MGRGARTARGLRVARVFALNSIAGLSWLPRPARAAIYRGCGVAVGELPVIFPGQLIRPGDLRIGDRCFINARCMFDPGSAGITIEDDVYLAQEVILAADTHRIGPSARRAGPNQSAAIVIGRGSWLGARVTVLPGVTVGGGCVIAAGAVVTRDTEPDCLYAGVPATKVRHLD